MKFLLDENVHSGVFSFLSKIGYDVKWVPKSVRNGEIFLLAVKEERILISRDADFLASRFISSRHFGIWLLRLSPEDIEGQRNTISNLLKQYPESESFKDKIVKLLSPSKFELK